MKEWFKENQGIVIMGTLTSIVVGLMIFLQGCNLQEYIKVDAPKEVLEAVDLPEGELTLDEADQVWQDWTHYVNSNSDKFKTSVAKAEEKYVFYESLISTGLGVGEGALQSFPAGAMILSLLTGATGLMLKRPKEDIRVAKEKEASYNAGIELGKKLATEALKKSDSNT